MLLVLLSLTVVSVDLWGGDTGALGAVRGTVADTVAPVRDAVAAIVSPVGDAVSSVGNDRDLRAENQELRERNADLESSAAQSEALLDELEALRSLLDIDFVGDLPTVAARVKGGGVANFEDTVEIDRGSDKGVAVGNPVVTAAGLVGRVVSVSADRAQVRLITSPSSGVGVRFPTVDELGLAQGQGAERPLSVDGIHKSPAEIRDEPLVYTSGQEDSLFPADIPVGRITSATRGPGEVSTSVELTPVADIDHVDHVAVISWLPQPGP